VVHAIVFVCQETLSVQAHKVRQSLATIYTKRRDFLLNDIQVMKSRQLQNILWIGLVLSIGAETNDHSRQPHGSNYGVDCSFPIHSREFRCGSLLGDRKSFYDAFMKGCREKYGESCDSNEERRISTTLNQPESVAVSPPILY
jgi:hypothetical protein